MAQFGRTLRPVRWDTSCFECRLLRLRVALLRRPMTRSSWRSLRDTEPRGRDCGQLVGWLGALQQRPTNEPPVYRHDHLLRIDAVLDLSAFAILTDEPNELVADYHDRMPLALADDKIISWLDLSNADPWRDDLLLDLKAFTVRPMDRAMNNARQKDLSAIDSQAA
jgi:SOS response associated peptidase (SRAP)